MARTSGRSSALDRLKALRASGKKHLESYEVRDEERVYDEVDEEGYKKVVRSRLDRDDFVVDDNGGGYADDGREEWDRGGEIYSSEESDGETALKGRGAKRKREEEREKVERTNHNINKYFTNGAGRELAKEKKPAATVEDAAFMADLLGEVDSNTVYLPAPKGGKVLKSEGRRKVRVLSPPPKQPSKHEPALSFSSSPTGEHEDENDSLPTPVEDDVVMSDPIAAPSSPTVKAVQRKVAAASIKTEPTSDDEDNIMEIAQVAGGSCTKTKSVNISGSRPLLNQVKKRDYPTPESSSPLKPALAHATQNIDAGAWNDVTSKLNVLSSPAEPGTATIGKARLEDCVEDDGSLRIFWTDYTEINGSLCLFGKVRDRKNNQWTSSFVKVDGILRKLFFLPRIHKLKRGREIDEEVEMGDVYQEVDELMSKVRVGMHKIKPCTRKYAFELPEIPKEAEYLKLMYPYDKPALPMDTKGDTFSHVFGTNTALFEQFVLWKNIMGPCWLSIAAEEFSTLSSSSWCKLEISVPNAKAISTVSDSDNLDAPAMTFMSLALRTSLNVKENKQEILAISARTYENIFLSDTTPPEKIPCKTFTIMRPADAESNNFPIGFEALCKQQRGTYQLEKTEQMLLSRFLAMLERIDPDVLIGHQLQDVDYPILLSRLRERKTPSWHRIGRLRRSEWPKNMGKGGSSFFAERQLVSGRLLCDIANDMGKSLMTKCQSWSLGEMCDLYLSGTKRQDIDSESALKSWGSTKGGLLNYVTHCEADTHFIAAIAMRVQMLPLSKVLTNLAGNSWARTLSGTRAERNEYILLHEFYKNKYICPDKVYGRQKAVKETEEGEEAEAGETKKKDKFKGGLVFEPEKGLYDKFILVMDFNSLYPSIIQEFNICFTTVERHETGEDEERVPEVPEDQSQGILPRLIATLVSRRREVKKLMKDKNATPEQLATWDIKQLALKLTANSMYGCLGYTQSRFYARPLAMLTTFQGREILRSTKELAESTQLRVIYGDTDSVMINTNADTFEEALKVGSEFKRSVNERYKLLEIDIDNVFRRLLLHAKKKYAAINIIEVDGRHVDKLEVKGLDMRRREYCGLSKDASSALLNEILSGEDPDVVVGKIHDYLRELAQSMRDGKVRNEKYIIYTKLGKDPKSYPNASSMPQVQVALRAIANGKTVRVNDVISYITTAPISASNVKVEDSDPKDSKNAEPTIGSNSSNPAQRAYSLFDVQKSGGVLSPDVDWYLAKQIFPPIERLCAPIAGTDAGQLAECLGLDPKRYALGSTSSSNQSNGLEVTPLDSQLPDSIRYQDCPRLHLACLKCRAKIQFNGLGTVGGTDNLTPCVTPKGIVCPAENCHYTMKTITIVAQVEHAIRNLTSTYYDAYLVCDDPSCGIRTRGMSVYGHCCPGPNGRSKGCSGRMRLEKSGKWIGNALSYWRGLWDVDHEAKGGGPLGREERERVSALREHNRERFATVKQVIEGYEKLCGWSWVQMDAVFGFALR